ncbi:hypothetical protein UlMin_037540 [Ulmus minor]
MSNWPRPTTVTEIRSFLGMAGYYRRFVEGFSRIVGPLTMLTRKNVRFTWTEDCEKSFQELKKRLTTAHVLAIPSGNDGYQATIGMAPYEALYGHKCRSPIHWHETGEQKFMEPDFVDATTQAVKQIRERMKAAQDRQKSYTDTRRRPLEFEVGDHVFLKVAPMKGVMHFGRKGKLHYRFIGPYEILE